jgi:transcriptional regulator with XRE-family HTH domain
MSGWTREELAGMLGVSVETVYEWEAGKEPVPNAYAACMAALFGVKVPFLLGREHRWSVHSERVA